MLDMRLGPSRVGGTAGMGRGANASYVALVRGAPWAARRI
ncbi:hypothetical protein AG1IA_04397 [Rhizoctonia solani AG-1 IA]|uniref:Uncharacterized protein n=1 Tax=Thanatephorus cucumeris (strain AG1-IA) TaxID=983506 RepID=L8WYX3_THACA|nr:hypothetical protein AG1IA_04397 [Rhizoctonia solani AG-1 IA]